MIIKILAHRGFWKTNNEKNGIIAFERAFRKGYGIETDIRDLDGMLVVSHDMPRSPSLAFEDLLKLHNNIDNRLPLALNIKSDGLCLPLKKLLEKYAVPHYFVFDMSIPDMLGYWKEKVSFYSRHSEYEETPSLYEEASGIWLDELISHWIVPEIVEGHLDKLKNVCIVSPELHQRDHLQAWKEYRQIHSDNQDTYLMLCTDFPEKAEAYFNETN